MTPACALTVAGWRRTALGGHWWDPERPLCLLATRRAINVQRARDIAAGKLIDMATTESKGDAA